MMENYSFNIYRIRELHNIMASFAKIGLNGKVIEVQSVVNEVLHDLMELNKNQ
jgi:hypothetical protein